MAVTLHVSAGCLGEGGEGPSSTAARTERDAKIEKFDTKTKF
jgi:hypothetical protein